MSTLANETIFETLFEETLEELGINEDSPFFADACKSVRTIYHFNWSGLTCPECRESIDKYDWLVETRGVV